MVKRLTALFLIISLQTILAVVLGGLSPSQAEDYLREKYDPAQNGEIDTEVKTVSPGIMLRGSKVLSRGESAVVSEGSPGFEAKVYRVSSMENGEEKRELISHDHYAPEPRILEVGM
ncbi:MAG: G5 domain-containing protein [Bacillota bacterium]